MSMDGLAQSLISESEKEAKITVSKAKKEAEKIVSKVNDSEKQRIEHAVKDVKERLDSKKKERIAWASLEKKRILSEARGDLVDSVLGELLVSLPNLRKHSSYPSFMKSKFKDAMNELNEDKVIVHIVKGDKKFLNSFAKSKKVKVVEDLNASGGILVQNSSKTVSSNYTLETLFELKKPELRRQIYRALFGG